MSQKARVVMLDFLSEAEIEKNVLKDVATVECWEITDNESIPIEIEKVDAILLWHVVSLPKHIVERLKKCKIVVRVGVGFDSVDLKACARQGILVVNIPDYGTEEVADHTITLLLNIMRRVTVLNNKIKATKTFENVAVDAKGSSRIRGKFVGIIGSGMIGIAVARRCAVLGFKVGFYDPYTRDGLDKSIGGLHRFESVEELLKCCDVVTLHCDLNDTSRHIINHETLKSIPRPKAGEKGIYFVNTSRGGCVDTESLVEALEDGRVYAAGLDVLEEEPIVSKKLLSMENVLLTPHTAFYSDEAFVKCAPKLRQKYCAYLQVKIRAIV
eukprot:TRINITY_DN727_c0_g1_i1.p1 TRINITY_DN727_c0_g1~~TRINITY_DN727_c0_g1_i1.p1  ORF type:complete len:327 (+),score=44.18 TRINITY_DN727_c0_g1_i1:72-1052(+)